MFDAFCIGRKHISTSPPEDTPCHDTNTLTLRQHEALAPKVPPVSGLQRSAAAHCRNRSGAGAWQPYPQLTRTIWASPSPSTIMPGFTPINAHALQPPASNVDALPEMGATTGSGRPKPTKRRQPARKKPPVRRDDSQVAADNTTRKRISGKGRKRTSHPDGEPEPKRRKSGDLKSSMPTTKIVVSATETANPDELSNAKAISSSSTDAGLVSLTSMAKLNGFHYTRGHAARSGGIEPQSIHSTSVTYAPETSMDSVSVFRLLRTHHASPMTETTRNVVTIMSLSSRTNHAWKVQV